MLKIAVSIPLLTSSIVALACFIAAVASAGEPEAAALGRRLAQFYQDAGAGNLEELMSLYAEDATILGPSQPPIAGSAAIRAWWKGILDQFQIKAVPHLDEIVTIGDAIVVRGGARGILALRIGGEPVPVDNWFLQIYRRQADGSLRFWRGSYGPNIPASQPQ